MNVSVVVPAHNEAGNIRRLLGALLADLDVKRDVVEKMVCFLRDHPEVGMVGGRPVPNNDWSTLVGRMDKLLWELHHQVSLEVPKMGEIVAFPAHLVEHVSEPSVVDEASIEDTVRGKGERPRRLSARPDPPKKSL